MIFGSLTYPVFLALSVAAWWLLPNRARPWLVAAAGLAFYWYYARSSTLLIVALIAAVWLLGIAAERSRAAFLAGILVPLAALGYFKYAGMLSYSASWAAPQAGFQLPKVGGLFLPLAISFFTFEFIHYIIDRRRGMIPKRPLSRFLAFALFFPTMVAGPIKRFEGFDEQLNAPRLAPDDAWIALVRIATGAAKKFVLADSLALFVRPLLERRDLADLSPRVIVVALVAYSLRIYFDFSGYSDIAIGSARLFGIRVPENFDWPYLRSSIAEFWRHWHMSLQSWIADYIYKPLGGSKRGLGRTVANTLIAMSVSGLWHGAEWHYVVWGLYHGVLLVLYRLWRTIVRPRTLGRFDETESAGGHIWRRTALLRRAGSVALTFALVTVGWGLFIMPVRDFVVVLGALTGAG
jgi:alginate O-acetyltransferase complex protein AlgI